jgi:hypothetical protein
LIAASFVEVARDSCRVKWLFIFYFFDQKDGLGYG